MYVQKSNKVTSKKQYSFQFQIFILLCQLQIHPSPNPLLALTRYLLNVLFITVHRLDHLPLYSLPGYNACLPDRMILRILVADKQFPILPISSRLIPCHLHHVEPARRAVDAAEDAVHFLE